METVDTQIAAARANMQKTVDHLDETLSRVRAGKASPKLLDGIMVNYYGNPTPLNQVASVTLPDAKSIVVTPWEKSLIREIEKAIMDSSLGITPENNGELIRLGIPPLTEDRRKQLVKQIKADTEDARISIRNARRDAIDTIKKAVKTDGLSEDLAKDAEAEIQKIHDSYMKKLEEVFVEKEKEIMTV